MSSSIDRAYARFYGNRAGFVDGTTEFHQLISKYATESPAILEIGPGPRNSTSDYLSQLGLVTGADVSREIEGNSAIATKIIYDGASFPLGGRQFDLVVSNYVLEHIADPRAHFREVARLLRPGGVYVFRTPNLWHYVALTSRALPHAVHRLLANRLRALRAGAHEPYPTHYRANTRRQLRRSAAAASLEVAELRMIEKEPSYGRASRALFFPMMVYERIVNSSSMLEIFRSNILGVVRARAL